MSVSAEIWLGHFALVADPVGRFNFTALPRVGELIVVSINDERQVLEVKSITHDAALSDNSENESAVRLLCTKAT